MQEKHNNCRNSCVLIQIGKDYKCGLILACGDMFCYILTTKISALRRSSCTITFGNGMERTFNASDVLVKSGSKLSVIFLFFTTEILPKQRVSFSVPENMEGVIYKLTYIPKSSHEGDAPTSSCFRGGQLG